MLITAETMGLVAGVGAEAGDKGAVDLDAVDGESV